MGIIFYEFELGLCARKAAHNLAFVLARDNFLTKRCWFATFSLGDFGLGDEPRRGTRKFLHIERSGQPWNRKQTIRVRHECSLCHIMKTFGFNPNVEKNKQVSAPRSI